MTEAAFRTIALSMPHAVEGSHMDHADFRVKGKIFATLPQEGVEEATGGTVKGWSGVGVLKLTLDQQDEFMDAWPGRFEPVKGAWGMRGYTRVALRSVTAAVLRKAMEAAWKNTAPKSMHGEIGKTATGRRAK